VAEFPARNGDGNLHQEGEDEETYCPNAERHDQFQEIGDILIDLAEGIRDKSRHDETRPFLNPDPCYDEKATQVEGAQPFPRDRDEEDEKGRDGVNPHSPWDGD